MNPNREGNARRAALVGAIALVISIALMLAPLAISLGKGAKYLVAPGFIGACAALSILLNAAIDRVRKK